MCGVIWCNMEILGLNGVVKIFWCDVICFGELGIIELFDFLFVDLFYDKGLGEKVLIFVVIGGWFKLGVVCVFEEWVLVEILVMFGFEDFDWCKIGDS